jgi:4-amino-4-deoxy-L-arabinose transferase-like glycosyltransferase
MLSLSRISQSAARLLALVSALAATFAFLRLSAAGALPVAASAVLVPAAFLSLVAAAFWVATQGETKRPLLARHGFWVIAIGTAISLPFLGAFGLTDPWETHYAEVAREMIARHDFISPWWAHDGFFMSKPILVFWLEGASMLALGVHTSPDRVLAGGATLANPEWAVRLPSFLLSLAGAYFLYKGVARTCGRRAGAIGAIVLLTTPAFAMIGHQAITDMPLVGSIAAAVGLFLVSLSANEGEELPAIDLGFGPLHAGRAVAAVVGLFAMAQVAYLVSRQVDIGAGGIHWHTDRYFSGSPLNCSLPGQPPCARATIAHPALQPAFQACFLLPLGLFAASRAWNERRTARVAALAAWVFAALATAAKGPAGVVIPCGAIVLYVLATRSWRAVAKLELFYGALILVVMVVPWYVAVYARHGRAFIDELVFRHMLGRTLEHLHDTNDGEDTGLRYYIWQLGYALFPWTGIAFAAALQWARSGVKVSARARAKTLLFAWALLAFVLVSMMHTKFHHYMLPVVPPLAMLAGIWIDELLPRRGDVIAHVRDSAPTGTRARVQAPRAALLVGAACVTALVGRDLLEKTGSRDVSGQARLMQLFTYRYDRAWPDSLDFLPVFAVFVVAASVALLLFAFVRLRRIAAVATGAVAIAFAVFTLDVYLPKCSAHWGQRPLIDAFYRARGADGPPLVAYQMNWKGENFYTGNRVAIFVTSGAPMKNYLGDRKKRGEGEVYFVTEHDRVAGLRSELGTVQSFEKLTDTRLDRQFCLVRAVL